MKLFPSAEYLLSIVRGYSKTIDTAHADETGVEYRVLKANNVALDNIGLSLRVEEEVASLHIYTHSYPNDPVAVLFDKSGCMRNYLSYADTKLNRIMVGPIKRIPRAHNHFIKKYYEKLNKE
jgi:hypothetical protein